MKRFITAATTAVVSLCGVVFIAMKALELPLVLESVWSATIWMANEPLLLAAIMLSTILVIGRVLDFVHSYNENRQQRSSESEAVAS